MSDLFQTIPEGPGVAFPSGNIRFGNPSTVQLLLPAFDLSQGLLQGNQTVCRFCFLFLEQSFFVESTGNEGVFSGNRWTHAGVPWAHINRSFKKGPR